VLKEENNSQAVRISTSASPAAIFHLTNATAPTVAEVLIVLFQQLGLPAPIFTANKDEFKEIDRKFDEGIGYYRAHMTSVKDFNRSNSDAALGDRNQGAYHLTAEKLAAFARWYLDRLVVERPRLVSACREAQNPV
jgi:hypothetical protein